MSARPVLLIGTSTRAAAYSCRLAGFQPSAIDRFGDQDLASLAQQSVVITQNAPAEILNALGTFPGQPVVYLGGLENQPDLIEQVAARNPLWGNQPGTLRQVREPFLLAEILKSQGISVPLLRKNPAELPLNGSWLEKPLASGGGLGVRVWDRSAAREPATEPVVYQARVAGPGFGASFLADPKDGCTLLGVCRSWQGAPWGPFVYRASLGPISLSQQRTEELTRIGSILTQQFGLRGLFGVDLIRDPTGQIHVIEVNPRITASIEVLERAAGQTFFPLHARAFDNQTAKAPATGSQPSRRAGKAIIYAQAPCQVPARESTPFDQALRAAQHPSLENEPSLADIPWPGTRFARGEPVCTVFAQAHSMTRSNQKLRELILIWSQRLASPTWTPSD